MIKGNKGEWSEIYTLLKLLYEGKMYSANENLEKLSDKFFPILEIIRKENDDIIRFVINENNKKSGQNDKYKEYVNILVNDVLKKQISRLEFKYSSDLLLDTIKNTKKKSAFEIPEIEKFMDKIFCSKIKADSNSKSDIDLKIIDVNTGYNPEVGFSIKSKLGSSATLLNAGKSTNFSFAFQNMSDDTQHIINSMFIENNNTKKKSLDLRGRIKYLEDNGISYKFNKVINDKFNDNLVMIDSYMDRIIASMLLCFYRDNIRKSEDLISEIVSDNPLNYGNQYAYEYKFKKFLTAIALGMRPATLWNGLDEANGGYIVVNKNGEPLTYHIHNRNYFEDYLIKNTKFETASTSKHNFGKVYEEDGIKFIDLNLQIRFI